MLATTTPAIVIAITTSTGVRAYAGAHRMVFDRASAQRFTAEDDVQRVIDVMLGRGWSIDVQPA